MRITFARIGADETIRFAVEELEKYLYKIDNEIMVDIRLYDAYDKSVNNVIWVGAIPDFDGMKKVKEIKYDDAILIDVVNSNGVILGNNPRATLIAAYRFLKELGVNFIRPGRDGEMIDVYSIAKIDVHINEVPSYRHRGVVIEGPVGYMHVKDMIDYLPKLGLNSYYFQFFKPLAFFKKWYGHLTNKYFEDEGLTDEDIEHIYFALKEEVKKRNLILHAVGHGWTLEPFKIYNSGWDKFDDAVIPDDARKYFAQIDGKRGLFKNIPLNTNLCYSNPEARKMVVDVVVKYCQEHPEVDVLHFAFADDFNNHCECENCNLNPSDYYVMFLNEIDEEFIKLGIDVKIQTDCYGDTLLPPKVERIKYPDRHPIEFCPITRSYTKSYKDIDFDNLPTPKPYVKNKNVMPKTLEENIAYFFEWRKQGSSDSFCFEYHLMWDHMKDPGYYDFTKTLFYDMQNLDLLDLNGSLSCQLNRTGYPTGLPMQLMADALWDKTCDFEERTSAYFKMAFGLEGESVKKYMSDISAAFDIVYMRHEKPRVSKEAENNFSKAIQVLINYENTIDENISKSTGNLKKSWEYLKLHNKYTQKLARGMIYIAKGDKEKGKEVYEELLEEVRRNEMKYHKVHDELYYYAAIEDALIFDYEVDFYSDENASILPQ